MTDLSTSDLAVRLNAELGSGGLDDRAALQVLARPAALSNGTAAAYLERRSGDAPGGFEHPIVPEKESCHATLHEVLHPTLGLILYREQTLILAERISDFGREDLRRLWLATVKLNGPAADDLRTMFVSRRSSSWTHDEAARIWALMVAASPVVMAAGDAYRAAARSMADERVGALWPTNLHAHDHGAA
jgi:DNA polymerase III alpha subunit